MKTKQRIYEFFYYFIIGGLCTFSIATNSLAATVLGTKISTIVLFSLIFISFFYFAFFNKYTVITITGTIFLSVLVVLAVLWRQNFEAEWFAKFKVYLYDLSQFVLDKSHTGTEYNKLLELAIIFLIALVVASTIRNWLGFYAITTLGMITLAIPAIKNWEKSMLGRYCFLFCFVVLLLEKLNFLTLEKNSKDSKVNAGYGLMAIPISVLVILVSLMLPNPDVSDYSVINELDSVGKSILDEASVDVSIFNEDRKKLGGPLVLGDEKVMEVQSEEPLYLKGLTMDTYTGTEWYNKKSDKSVIKPNNEWVYDINSYSDREKANQLNYSEAFGFTLKTVKIYPETDSAVKTRRIYTAPFSSDLNLGENKLKIERDGTGSVWANKFLPADIEYTQRYIPWIYDGPKLQTLLSNAPKVYEQELDKYLQLPETLPKRVTDLAQELADSEINNYAKLRKIESYLRANYPYTLETSSVPTGEDFVDYFLFTEKQGYCVYYATAMVVMARTQGIPARYVEGYVMPPNRNENGNYAVTNKQAHAWVEAYFPDFGWVRFEPTAAYSADIIRDIPESVITPPEDSFVIPPEEIDENPIDEEILNEDTHTEISDRQAEETDKKEVHPVINVLIITIFMAGLLVLGINFLIKHHKTKFEKIDKLSHKEKTLAYFEYILKILKTLGHSKEESETVIEYANRIKTTIDTVDLSKIAELFSKSAYSDKEISDEESELMKTSYYTLLEELRISSNDELKFNIERYILMKF